MSDKSAIEKVGIIMFRLEKDRWYAFHLSENDMVLEWIIEHYSDIPFEYTINHLSDNVTQYCLYYGGGIWKRIYYTTIDVSEARKLIEETIVL